MSFLLNINVNKSLTFLNIMSLFFGRKQNNKNNICKTTASHLINGSITVSYTSILNIGKHPDTVTGDILYRRTALLNDAPCLYMFFIPVSLTGFMDVAVMECRQIDSSSCYNRDASNMKP